jgi:hypothetical protein
VAPPDAFVSSRSVPQSSSRCPALPRHRRRPIVPAACSQPRAAHADNHTPALHVGRLSSAMHVRKHPFGGRVRLGLRPPAVTRARLQPPSRSACGILCARWAGSSMAEQLTLNQLVGSSSLPRLTTPANTKRPPDSFRGPFVLGSVPHAIPATAIRRVRPFGGGSRPYVASTGPATGGRFRLEVLVRRLGNLRVPPGPGGIAWA